MTVDVDALIDWLRDFSGPGSNGTNEAADALVQLRDERDAAREAHEDTITSDIATLRRRTHERDEALAAIERARNVYAAWFTWQSTNEATEEAVDLLLSDISEALEGAHGD